MDKKIYSFGIAGFGILFILGILGISGGFNNGDDGGVQATNVITTRTSACIYINGVEHDCQPNIFFDEGRDYVRDLIGGSGSGSALNISLCNTSTRGKGCGTPNAANTAGFERYTTCGLGEIIGTYEPLAEKGNWTVTATFTNTCSTTLETNVTFLRNVTGTNVTGISFTLASLENNDQLTVNITGQTQ